MKLNYKRFDLPCRHPFTISRGSTTVQQTVVVELAQEGCRGYGEAIHCPFYGATVEGIAAALERVRPMVESWCLDDPIPFWEAVRGELAAETFTLAALDMAAYDLWGKLRRQPVWKLLGFSLEGCPPSDYTIGIDTTEVMLRKMAEFPGWPVYKIKLGTPDDLAIVRALRAHTDALFRVDANCAWDVEETIRNAAALAELGVEFIEQPLPRERWDEARAVFARAALPIIADESCQAEEDVERCAGAFHGVNVKLAKCGGITPARRMLTRARRMGMKTMVGCFTESSVGISAAAQLLPLLDYADLDGAVLLGEDVARGVAIDRGRIRFPEENGCGVTLLDTDAG